MKNGKNKFYKRYYDRDFIENLKHSTSMVDLVSSYLENKFSHLDTSLEPAGTTYKCLCPFHDEDTPSFHVDPDKNTFCCYGCGKKGDVFDFVGEAEGLGKDDFTKKVAIIAEREHTLPGEATDKRMPFDKKELAEYLGIYSKPVRIPTGMSVEKPPKGVKFTRDMTGNGMYILMKEVDSDPIRTLYREDKRGYYELVRDKAHEKLIKMQEMAKFLFEKREETGDSIFYHMCQNTVMTPDMKPGIVGVMTERFEKIQKMKNKAEKALSRL